MTLTARAGLASLRRPLPERTVEQRFAIVLLLVSAAAWGTLVTATTRGMMMGSHHVASGAVGAMPAMTAEQMAAMAGPSAGSLSSSFASMPTALGMWDLMVVAMMLPTALPAVLHTGAHSLRWRRPRAMILCAMGYVIVWLAAGVLLVPVAVLAPSGPGTLIAALLLAAAWQLAPLRRRAVRNCHRPRPLHPSGWAADAASIRFGLFNGAACLGACWALMLVASLVATADLAWMAVIGFVVAGEKLSRRPRRAAVTVGVGAVACAALVMALSLS